MKYTEDEVKAYLESNGRPWDAFFVCRNGLTAFRDDAGQLFFLPIDDEPLEAAVNRLLTREGKTEPCSDSLNALAMRLRRITSRPPLMCVELLRRLPALERVRYVEYCESSGLSLFIDPIELDQDVMPVFATVRESAKHLFDEGEFGRGMGAAGNMHVWMQRELAYKYGIRWRTPREMNPGVAFD